MKIVKAKKNNLNWIKLLITLIILILICVPSLKNIQAATGDYENPSTSPRVLDYRQAPNYVDYRKGLILYPNSNDNRGKNSNHIWHYRIGK